MLKKGSYRAGKWVISGDFPRRDRSECVLLSKKHKNDKETK